MTSSAGSALQSLMSDGLTCGIMEFSCSQSASSKASLGVRKALTFPGSVSMALRVSLGGTKGSGAGGSQNQAGGITGKDVGKGIETRIPTPEHVVNCARHRQPRHGTSHGSQVGRSASLL